MSARFWIAAPFAFALLFPVDAGAQDRPAVFIHGLASNGGDWIDASTRLRLQVAITPEIPTMGWRKTYADQAQELQTQDATRNLPGTTLAIGHSNGGVVAREWSKSRPLTAVVTVGTPHRGAPLVQNFAHWHGFNLISRLLLSESIEAFTSSTPWQWVLEAAFSAVNWLAAFSVDSVVHLGVMLGLDAALPVANQMVPSSSYLASLNSSANLARESGALTGRIGIASIARNYYYAGVARAVAPASADEIAYAMYASAALLDFWGAYVLTQADPSDAAAMGQAFALLDLAGQILSIDPVYCASVSRADRSACVDNDGVLPVDTQLYPGGLNLLMGQNNDGPAHTQEKQMSDAALYEALVTHLHIPRRADEPPPPPAPGDPPPPPDDSPDDHEVPPAGSPHVLFAGDVMWPNEIVHSYDGRFHFMYQGDGNLVLFDADWEPLWSSGTPGIAPGMVAMQHDGNFVMYDEAGTPVWSADGSWGHPGAYLIVQNDGNVVIYDEDGTPLWETETSE